MKKGIKRRKHAKRGTREVIKIRSAGIKQRSTSSCENDPNLSFCLSFSRSRNSKRAKGGKTKNKLQKKITPCFAKLPSEFFRIRLEKSKLVPTSTNRKKEGVEEKEEKEVRKVTSGRNVETIFVSSFCSECIQESRESSFYSS